jgi:hypothetical protein
VHQGDAVLVRERVPGKRKVHFGGVVFEVHGGQVNARPAAQQPGNFLNFLRALQDDGVHGVCIQRCQVHLPH